VWYTGSSSRLPVTAAASSRACAARPDGHQPASSSVIRADQARAATDASSHATWTATGGSAARGANTAAANGG
jgi:hypothetical protein